MFGSQSERFMLRDDVEFDQTDLSFITSMAAIGDSYSAGIGAGDRLGDATQFLDPQSGKSLYLLHRYGAQLTEISHGKIMLAVVMITRIPISLILMIGWVTQQNALSSSSLVPAQS
jgi:hypothetical protein